MKKIGVVLALLFFVAQTGNSAAGGAVEGQVNQVCQQAIKANNPAGGQIDFINAMSVVRQPPRYVASAYLVDHNRDQIWRVRCEVTRRWGSLTVTSLTYTPK